MDRRSLDRALRALAVASIAAMPLASRATNITLLHVNDTHSHLDAVGPRDASLQGTSGGLARAATVIAQARATTPGTLLVHAGDLFQGDVAFNATYGVAEWQLLARLGLDAMAVGNHEFHLGPQVLAGALAQAFPLGDSPLLSANLDLAGFPVLGLFVKAHSVKEIAGVRVGLFGLTTPFDPAAAPAPVGIEPDVAHILDVARAEAEALRSEGADVVVCLSHLGFALDQVLAAQVPGLDAIVGGHDHRVLPQPVVVPGPLGRQVAIVQAGENYEWVGKLTLAVEAGGVSVAGYELVPVDASVEPFAPFAPALRLVDAAVAALFDDVGARVAFAPFGVSRTPSLACLRDSGAGNLVTDAMRARTGTALAFTVHGLIPDGLARGPLLGVDLFRVVGDGFDVAAIAQGKPFPSAPLYTLDITGADLVAAIETTLAAPDPDLALEASGMTVRLDSTRPPGSRVLAASVGGRPLDPAHVYRATVNFGVLQGLPALGVNVSNVAPVGDHEYDALLAFARRLHVLVYTSQGRALDVGARCFERPPR